MQLFECKRGSSVDTVTRSLAGWTKTCVLRDGIDILLKRSQTTELMLNHECGSLVVWPWKGKTEIKDEKHLPGAHRPPQIPHGLACDPALPNVFQRRAAERRFYRLQSVRTGVGPTQPHILGVPGGLSSGSKWPEHEADHSLHFSAEIKNTCSFATTPSYAFIACYFISHRFKITLKRHAYRHTFFHYNIIFITVRGIQYLYLLNHNTYIQKPTCFGTKYLIVITVTTHNFFYGATALIGPCPPQFSCFWITHN